MLPGDAALPTYERFLLAAQLLGIPPEELAKRLAHKFDEPESVHPREDEGSPQGIKIHAKYLGVRVEALYDPSKGDIKVLSGPRAGQVFSSASRAAIAVVQALNPDRESANTNGRLFWIVTGTGQPLRSLLGRR